MRRILLVLVLVMETLSCSRVVERPGSASGAVDATAGTTAGASEPMTEAFVRVTIDVACLSSRIPDPRDRVEPAWAIYRRHGFDDPDQYLALMETLGRQAQVQEKIARGIAQCP